MLELSGAAGGALATAVAITLLELTEAVAIVYALGAASHSLRPGLLGSAAGVALVGGIGLVVGVGISHAPLQWTLLVGAVLLWSFGFWLLRSTFGTYLREDRRRRGSSSSTSAHSPEEPMGPRGLFATGFSVGSIEALEAVIVLVGIAAGGFPIEALVGALLAGVLLVVAGALLHERIRRLKVPPVKWATTSLLWTYAIFWTGESLGQWGLLAWPSSVAGLPSDVLLIPIFLGVLVLVRLLIQVRLSLERPPSLR